MPQQAAHRAHPQIAVTFTAPRSDASHLVDLLGDSFTAPRGLALSWHRHSLRPFGFRVGFNLGEEPVVWHKSQHPQALDVTSRPLVVRHSQLRQDSGFQATTGEGVFFQRSDVHPISTKPLLDPHVLATNLPAILIVRLAHVLGIHGRQRLRMWSHRLHPSICQH